ncbi:MAG: hybrid sensor histidine kinase/response regulator, partial [Hylemonella sp.]
DLTARVKWIAVADPLRDLQQGLNSMAERLAQGRDELEQRIKEATDALRLRTEEAEAANQAKLQFIAAASHDLRQPTHALGLFVSRLGQLVDDPKTLELVNDLELALHDMQDLLDVLLDFSRLQEKTFQPRLQAIDLQELLENLGASFSMQAASKGLSLKVRTRAAWVLSDPVLLRQIVLNLISNALRYTKQGRILVACRALAQGSRLRLEVWDTGIGIAAEHQQAIFKEYFQLSNAERDRRKGLGLGLSIVQRAADLLGHPVKLRSVPGRGSCFSIELPCTQRVSDPAPSPSPQSLLQGLSVLLVEDDPMVVKASEALLSSWACHLRSAENLDGALRLIEEGFSPDILISDYRLPGDFDGIAVLQQLQRACGTEIPAVLITGDTEENIIQRAKSAGLTVMHKPLRPAKLRSLLKNLRITAQI